MMPILFTIIGLCIGLKFGKSLKSGLYVGVGFVGLGIVTALLTNNFGDPLSEISRIYDLQLKVFDMGWPAAAVYAATGDNAAKNPDGFEAGALDFASSLFSWFIYRCTRSLEFVGMGILTAITLVMMFINRRQIVKSEKTN